MRKYWALSAIFGAAWGLFAYVLAARFMGRIAWGGVIAAPLIGLAVARLYLPAYGRSTRVRWFMALVTLYVAVTLFGLGVGIYDALPPVANRLTHAVVLQDVLGSLWGVTVSGYVLFLWPLTYATHWLIGRVAGVA